MTIMTDSQMIREILSSVKAIETKMRFLEDDIAELREEIKATQAPMAVQEETPAKWRKETF